MLVAGVQPSESVIYTHTYVCIYTYIYVYVYVYIYISGEGNGNHSSIFAWKTPWTEESGELQSMGSQRVEHD